jgi:hypothetical protein
MKAALHWYIYRAYLVLQWDERGMQGMDKTHTEPTHAAVFLTS